MGLAGIERGLIGVMSEARLILGAIEAKHPYSDAELHRR
jgi:hypothetical protein